MFLELLNDRFLSICDELVFFVLSSPMISNLRWQN